MRASTPIPDATVARDEEQERRLGVLLLDASSCGTTEADLASTG
jgi:hypothetical protein